MLKRTRQESAPSAGSSNDEDDSGNDAILSATLHDRETTQRPDKYRHLDEPVCTPRTMKCSLAPHGLLEFNNYDEFEVHYRSVHVNRCFECHRNFPTEHFLSLHIAENHDPLTATRRDRGEKTFRCFVEGCDKVCFAWQKRRMHLVDKHGYPRNYDFFIVNDGTDNRSSMLRPDFKHHNPRSGHESREDSAASDFATSAPENSTNDKDGSMDDIADAMSSLKLVPRSVRFGRGKGHGGLASR